MTLEHGVLTGEICSKFMKEEPSVHRAKLATVLEQSLPLLFQIRYSSQKKQTQTVRVQLSLPIPRSATFYLSYIIFLWEGISGSFRSFCSRYAAQCLLASNDQYMA
ncbi:hypothetical protein O6H91_22G051600 [Diphasiastrum complanatum]|uniref:Uncharacterized protein n=1 Tax=Diphasiastrum complanatum TaxID=34168 RepID=A0ACC2AFN9_DIPCM|nr:hypothetical protein O6H91_22G051600 [Diphasiastrum complanatum]